MDEEFISVEIRATGPVPGLFSILEIGACVIDNPREEFHRLLHPAGPHMDPSLPKDFQVRQPAKRVVPEEALKAFREWVLGAANGRRPCYVGFNASINFALLHHALQMNFGESLFSLSTVDLAAMHFVVDGAASPRLPTAHEVAGACGVPWDPKRNDAVVIARAHAAIFQRLRQRVAAQAREGVLASP